MARIVLPDRKSRDEMAEAVRALVSGRISNDEFESRAPVRSSDPVLWEVFWGGTWTLLSDLRRHKLRGEHLLDELDRRIVSRWVLFLRTDKPYEWPTLTRRQRIAHSLAGILTFGLSSKLYRRHFAKHGDFEVWPFISRRDFDEAIASPATLKGSI